MADKHSTYCQKEAEISEMHADVKTIKKIVLEGNGYDPLMISVPRLSDNVGDLKLTVQSLDRTVKQVMKSQDKYQGEKDGKAEIRRRTRWIIGIMVTVSAAMLSAVLFLMDKLMNHLPT